MKLCLPRKARSLVKSQLSAACAKQIAERGEGPAGRILPQEAGTAGLCGGTKIFRGTEEAGCQGGVRGQGPFCEQSGVVPPCCPQVGPARGSQPRLPGPMPGACCRLKDKPHKAARLALPVSPCPCSVE